MGMIRSIFDTEDLPEEENTVDSKKVKTEPIITESFETVPTVEVPQETISREFGRVDQRTISSGEPEKQIIENVKESEFTVNLDSAQEISEVTSVPTSELKNVVDAGENFLEFEKELTKIEEEVRLVRDSNIEIPANPFIEKSPPQKDQTGVFTAALEKGQKEKETHAPLEELLIVHDGSNLPNDVSEPVNTGFILPNRIEPEVENQGFILPSRTESTYDDSPNIIDFKPESKAEIIRKSGLAWSAGIAFFASVVFLLIIGWFADLLLGTAPWGAVGGIIVGSIIGFVQLFRLTSQILKNSDQ
jgi:F0F1-type ATP synthase assembly protein I